MIRSDSALEISLRIRVIRAKSRIVAENYGVSDDSDWKNNAFIGQMFIENKLNLFFSIPLF